MKYDSRQDTLAHISRVNELLGECAGKLVTRGVCHDMSKLDDPEKSLFDSCTIKLKSIPYGTDEYKKAWAELGPALQHHYEHNSHHPEHFPKKNGGLLAAMLRETAAAQKEQATAAMSTEPEAATVLLQTAERIKAHADELEAEVNNMTILDVLEMLMDWKAATERMKDGGCIHRSLEINTTRFKLSPQLANIFENTIREMGWQRNPLVKT